MVVDGGGGGGGGENFNSYWADRHSANRQLFVLGRQDSVSSVGCCTSYGITRIRATPDPTQERFSRLQTALESDPEYMSRTI